MKEYFSFKIYKQGLKRLKSIGFISLFIITFLNLITSVSKLLGSNLRSKIYSYDLVPYTPFLIIFSILFVYTAFSYMDEQKSKDLFFSIPKKRICIFLSFSSAVYSWIIFIILFSATLNGIMFVLSNYYDLSFSVYLEAILYYISSISLITSVFILGKIISSEKYMGVLFSIILLYAPRKIAYEYMLETFINSSSATQSNKLIQWFMHTPSPFSNISNYNAENYNAIKLFFIVSVIVFLMAFIFCIMRNREFYHSKAAKIICKVFFATIAFIPFIFDSALYLVDFGITKSRFIIGISYAVFFIIIMTLRDKKPKSILISALILLIPCGLSLVLTLSVPRFSKTLDEVHFKVEDIKRIEQLSTNQHAYVYTSKSVSAFSENPELPQYMESENEEAFEIAYSALERGIKEKRFSAVYLFELKNGEYDYRRIYLTKEDKERLKPYMAELKYDFQGKAAKK